MKDLDRKNTLRLIKKAIREFPKVLERQKRAHIEKEKVLKNFAPVSRELLKETIRNQKFLELKNNPEKIHQWRICPSGMFFRKKHVQNGYARKSGVVVRSSIHPGECVINRTGKDQLYTEEIRLIPDEHFNSLIGAPKNDDLGFSHGNNFDHLIRGWTKYWNEVLLPNEPLDPNLVKALIGTESSFLVDPPRPKPDILKARGLMQVTNDSRKYLAGKQVKGKGIEIRDHFVHVDLENMTDPNLNIAAGIRWLFRKKEIADSEGNKNGWAGAVLKYKTYTSLEHPQMQKFLKLYGRLKE